MRELRGHTQPYETAAVEALAPVQAELAPYAEAATGFVKRMLHLPEPILIELDTEAGQGLDVVLKTSLISGRVVVERVAPSSLALGTVAAGDTILEVNGKRPKNATHASNLISRATALSLRVQPGQQRVAQVLGPEMSDAAVVTRGHWRGVLAAVACMWLLLSLLGAPAAWAKNSAHASQVAAGRTQLRAVQRDLTVSMKRLEAATAAGATQRTEYVSLQKQHDELLKELAREKTKYKEAVAAARAMTNATESLRAREKALKAKFAVAKTTMEQKWREISTQVQKVTKDLGDTP